MTACAGPALGRGACSAAGEIRRKLLTFTFSDAQTERQERKQGLLTDGRRFREGTTISFPASGHQHLRKVSPFTLTVMVTHANGSIGYIPDDAPP